MAVTILIVLAGLMGAGGIVLAAAGAHVAPGAGLDSAAYLLVVPRRGRARRRSVDPAGRAVAAIGVDCAGRVGRGRGAVLRRHRAARFHRAPAVPDGGAVRRLHPHRRLARPRRRRRCGSAAQLTTPAAAPAAPPRRVSRSAPRSTSSATSRPIFSPVSARTRSSAPAMVSPSSATTMSPGLQSGARRGADPARRCRS